MKLLKIVAAIVLPPLAVFLERGVSKQLAVNIVLTLLGFLPGIIHALFVIA